MNHPLSPGQLVRVIFPMEVYPRRAVDHDDFHDIIYGESNPHFEPGAVLTILSSSLPAFHDDDTWYLALVPDGSTAWLIDCHNGVYYETT